MNLFILSLVVKECAEYMIDRHISKIILEAAQMLCTTYRLCNKAMPGTERDILFMSDLDEDNIHRVYRISHKNHPVTIWMRQSRANVEWTLELVDAMHNEWKWRYEHPADKIHKAYIVCDWIRRQLYAGALEFPYDGLTPFAQAMPEEYKCPGDAVAAYRAYYKSPQKAKIATWRRRGPPSWWGLP